LTEADEQINQLVIDAVKSKYPEIGILGEEQSHRPERTGGLLWVCDPIDGTLPYILGASASTFCLALVDNGRPVVGVVYIFDQDLLFSAARNLGVWCNGGKFKQNRTEPLPAVAAEYWYESPKIVKPIIEKLNAAHYQIVRYSSSGFEAMQVALGNLKGLVYAGDKPWDIAATKAIFCELGYM